MMKRNGFVTRGKEKERAKDVLSLRTQRRERAHND